MTTSPHSLSYTELPLGQACPLCRGSMKKTGLCYGHKICKKCSYKFANRRQGAWIIDIILIRIVEIGLFVMIILAMGGFPAPGGAAGGTSPGLTSAISWTLSLLFFLIFCFKDGFKGRSPGKMLTGVQVVDAATYEPIDFGRSFKRNILEIIPFMPIIMGIQLNKGPHFGDKFAKTKVIWLKYSNTEVFAPSLACEQCGYSLMGNTSGKCPECGRTVSARNQAALQEAPDSQSMAV